MIEKLVYRNLVTSFDRSFLIYEFIMAIIYIYIGGFAFSSFVSESGLIVGDRSISYPTFLATGIISLNLVWTCIISGTIVWNDRRSGMFDQILSMPFTRFQYILSNIFTIIILGLFTAIVTVVIGLPTLIGQVDINLVSLCYLVLAIVSCSVFFGSIVIAISIKIESLETLSYQLESGLISSIFICLILLSPIFYPLSMIDEPLNTLFKLNPLTYFSEIIRKSLFQQIDYAMVASTLGIITITCLFFLGILLYLKYSKIL